MSVAMARFTCGVVAVLSALGIFLSSAVAADPMFTKPIDMLTAYRDRPLFAPNRRAETSAPAVESSQEPSAAQPLNAVLLGVLSANDGSGLAVLQLEGEDGAKKLRIGESINGWQLDRVESHAAVFSSGDQNVTLSFPAASMTAQPNAEISQEGTPPVPARDMTVPVPTMPTQIINP